jgi:hypothetical protein
VAPWPSLPEADLELLIAGRGILLANFVAASDDLEDRALAPEYLARIEQRLRACLDCR